MQESQAARTLEKEGQGHQSGGDGTRHGRGQVNAMR